MGHPKFPYCPMQPNTDPAASAAHKMATGTLLKLAEVGAFLDVAPATVHGLPLSSVRIGRSLRFDPQDVRAYIESCKEPALLKECAYDR